MICDIMTYMQGEFQSVINAYFDESRIDNPESNFMVCGGVFIERKYAKQIRRDIRTILTESNFHGEVKWVKTDNEKIATYKKIIDYFFELPAYKASFNCIVVDKREISLVKYHNGDHELAFYKFIYQLLKKRIKPDTKYYLIFDYKPTKVKERLSDLGSYLDDFMYIEHAKTSKIKHIQGYNSDENVLIQLADLFSGAVAYSFNESASKQPKYILATYIASKIGHKDLEFCSSPSEKKFNIFAIDLTRRR